MPPRRGRKRGPDVAKVEHAAGLGARKKSAPNGRARRAAPARGAAKRGGDRRSQAQPAAADTGSVKDAGARTVEDVLEHPIMALARQHWAQGPSPAAPSASAFDAGLVQRLFSDDLGFGGSSAADSDSEADSDDCDEGVGAGRGGGVADGGGDGDESTHTRKRVSRGARARAALSMLELSGYLDNYLWPNYRPAAGQGDNLDAGGAAHEAAGQLPTDTDEHVLSVTLLVNFKCDMGVAAWDCFIQRPRHFGSFFHRVCAMADGLAASASSEAPGASHSTQVGKERSIETAASRRNLLTLFLVNCFGALEVPLVRKQALQLVGVQMWQHVWPARVEAQMRAYPQLRRHWAHAAALRQDAQDAAASAAAASVEADRKLGVELNSQGKGKGKGKGKGRSKGNGKAKGADKSASKGNGQGVCTEAEASAAAARKDARQRTENARRLELESSFMHRQIQAFLVLLSSTPTAAAFDATLAAASGGVSSLEARRIVRRARRARRAQFLHLAQFAQLLTDLLAQLPTRRFLLLLVNDAAFAPRCCDSDLFREGSRSDTPGDPAEEMGGDGAGVGVGVGVGVGGGSSGGSGALLRKLIARIAFYCAFPMEEQTGQSKSKSVLMHEHYDMVGKAQRAAFALAQLAVAEGEGESGREDAERAAAAAATASAEHTAGVAFSESDRSALRNFALQAIGRVSAPAQLLSDKALGALSLPALAALVSLTKLMPASPKVADLDTAATAGACAATWVWQRESADDTTTPLRRLRSIVAWSLRSRPSQLDHINALPLYPTESTLWDPDLVPLEHVAARAARQAPAHSGGGGAVLALPKLNLQALTLTDYLLRCWSLHRLESAHEIREDLVDAIERVSARPTSAGAIEFTGWSRMAMPIESFGITEIGEPEVGEKHPRRVTVEMSFSLTAWGTAKGGAAASVRSEWNELREHDVVFLIALAPSQAESDSDHAIAGSNKSRPSQAQREREQMTFPARRGVVAVRAARVLEMRDEAGTPMNDGAALAAQRGTGNARGGEGGRGKSERDCAGQGSRRTLLMVLDAVQYGLDVASGLAGQLYDGAGQQQAAGGVNLIVRRDGRANNFGAILSTIRSLMNAAEAQAEAEAETGILADDGGVDDDTMAEDGVGAAAATLPRWLSDTFLGYGDAAAASPRCTGTDVAAVDPREVSQRIAFHDTFVSADHLLSSFPQAKVQFVGHGETGTVMDVSQNEPPPPPYELTFSATSAVAASDGDSVGKRESQLVVQARSNKLSQQKQASQQQQPTNAVRFTPTQVRAIRAGMCRGLTLVVGPPGTGKTDVAVQIMSNLYRSFSSERVLVVTHSNAALNDIFQKLLLRGVDPAHMLRLGSGERQLRDALAQSQGSENSGGDNGGFDFSKRGRVDYALARRLSLLSDVGRLARSIGHDWNDAAATCQTAAHFAPYVHACIEQFEAAVAKASTDNATQLASMAAAFRFDVFCATSLSSCASPDDALQLARAWHAHLYRMFEELSELRPLELLRTQQQRADFVLTGRARIVAMTATHAALARDRLLDLRYAYDTLVCEEAAQLKDIETTIPLTLQRADPTLPHGRLQRVVLIGDHRQLPPVIKGRAFAQRGLSQSLFERFVRLGVPTVQLDAQGRARPEIAALYSWRYSLLGDMPHVTPGGATVAPGYARPNAGFAHNMQFVDVEDFQGRGESTPTAHYYQNLGEAEYAVACYSYMRLCGYPADRIAILTTYAGQKALLRDVLRHRCLPYSALGMPGAVETVDRFQGQQADVVLLSLVRTRAVGHLRDVRRLVVAMSRARFGLYIFGRKQLWEGSYELLPAFAQLLAKPTQLQLVMGERWSQPHDTKMDTGADAGADTDAAPRRAVHEVADAVEMGVLVHQLAAAAPK